MRRAMKHEQSNIGRQQEYMRKVMHEKISEIEHLKHQCKYCLIVLLY
jgi:hypothetical protein